MSGKGKDYRPICDTWLLAPSKVGYYGAYPNGFIQRARCLLGRMGEPILHVCSGKLRDYPGYGVGPHDKTLDINPLMSPDYCQDARDPFPSCPDEYWSHKWPAILMDPPYTEMDAGRYQQYVDKQTEVRQGIVCHNPEVQMAQVLPSPAQLLKNAWEVLTPGGKVGILHQFHPQGPSDARLVACIQVVQGANQQPRCFTVFEKPWVGVQGTWDSSLAQGGLFD
jgi:hypothetical protein